MKKSVAILLALLMLFSFIACGDKSDDVTGKYLCVAVAYDDGPLGKPSEESWIELKKGGKGTYSSVLAFDLEWTLDGESFVGTVSLLAMEDKMTGTLKDGVIEVKYGNETLRFVKEGVEAPAGIDESNLDSGIAGYYPVSSIIMDGEEWSLSEMEAFGMVEGVYLLLNANGTGVHSITTDDLNAITYDVKAGTITYPDGSVFTFTVSGDTITVVFEDDGNMTMCYTRSSDQAPAVGGTGNPAVTGLFNFDTVTVATTLQDAFIGAVRSGYGQTNGFVSTTTSLELKSTWYGIMECANFIGVDTDDYSKDVTAIIEETSYGYEYFEIYAGTEVIADNLLLSLYIQLYNSYFDADIGDEDAWIFNRYLVEDDEQYFSPVLVNGALEIWYNFVSPDDTFSCTVHFFLREVGAEWDEENDPLPPSYDDYKAGLGS